MKLWLKISFIQDQIDQYTVKFYNLSSFTFKQKENTSAPTERKVDKIMAINNVVNPTRIAKGFGCEYLIFKPDYSYWPFDNESKYNDAAWLGLRDWVYWFSKVIWLH
ncbi:hypothetical protein MCANPG14_02281 [Mycoplasmopsis canis PG 14]|uniref:hypothetical protein n=1 Tax=Mycoplasmopsis canis TaxID=29555 RepID=UPI00025AE9AB|nr:hypothetical protein [Mycoplasmopsis canis]EIE39859.1 hypothetical protein MCANPG14_02281 [Mycoplasmopsis canis PG 14]